ncbi:hypothetical protein [Mycobacteroides abscessus]|uniref:hypothetical protein n=1 Tax=Mycobacteroides abscessus TaxID=36809 RepID=UPI0012FEE2E8|nr:hypothetical protein [Mycobacteroides abscessus]
MNNLHHKLFIPGHAASSYATGGKYSHGQQTYTKLDHFYSPYKPKDLIRSSTDFPKYAATAARCVG